ncbi:GNAT family N-acetyltransferase [Rhizobium jaguaris]|nr:GNAT family N-acetyltransferase [Rhizobium jaguaris]
MTSILRGMSMASEIDIRPVFGSLPQAIHSLAIEARSEGFRFLDRLIDEWSDGRNRFDRSGECLLTAYAGDKLAGVGGVTFEPGIAGALRMRRFYIHPSMRRRGIGRMLASSLIDRARPATSLLTVYAATEDAPAFWEALGFQQACSDGYSHILRLD